MKRLVPTLAICLAAMALFSQKSEAAEFSSTSMTQPTQTAFFQPQSGGVVDVLTSPFRAIAAPFRTPRNQVAYQPYYGRANYGASNCINGSCYTGTGYNSSCTTGNCSTGACATGNCTTGSCGASYGNCPGGNCGTSQYQYPSQRRPYYGGSNWNRRPQYQTYRPVAQPVSRPAVPASTNSIRNDPFFP